MEAWLPLLTRWPSPGGRRVSQNPSLPDWVMQAAGLSLQRTLARKPSPWDHGAAALLARVGGGGISVKPQATADRAGGTRLRQAEGPWVTEPGSPRTGHGLAVCQAGSRARPGGEDARPQLSEPIHLGVASFQERRQRCEAKWAEREMGWGGLSHLGPWRGGMKGQLGTLLTPAWPSDTGQASASPRRPPVRASVGSFPIWRARPPLTGSVCSTLPRSKPEQSPGPAPFLLSCVASPCCSPGVPSASVGLCDDG